MSPVNFGFWMSILSYKTDERTECFFFYNEDTIKIETGNTIYTEVLLTMHLSIFISVFNQLDAQNLFHNKFYFMPLHVSSTCARNL